MMEVIEKEQGQTDMKIFHFEVAAMATYEVIAKSLMAAKTYSKESDGFDLIGKITQVQDEDLQQAEPVQIFDKKRLNLECPDCSSRNLYVREMLIYKWSDLLEKKILQGPKEQWSCSVCGDISKPINPLNNSRN